MNSAQHSGNNKRRGPQPQTGGTDSHFLGITLAIAAIGRSQRRTVHICPAYHRAVAMRPDGHGVFHVIRDGVA